MNERIDKALKGTVWAVVGATKTVDKFGYRIFKRLKDAGYTVFPLNPVYSEIDGYPCYAVPNELPEIPETVSMVLSPEKGSQWLEPLYRLGVRRLWFQPGAYDDAIVEKAEKIGFETIYGACVLVELNQSGR